MSNISSSNFISKCLKTSMRWIEFMLGQSNQSMDRLPAPNSLCSHISTGGSGLGLNNSLAYGTNFLRGLYKSGISIFYLLNLDESACKLWKLLFQIKTREWKNVKVMKITFSLSK